MRRDPGDAPDARDSGDAPGSPGSGDATNPDPDAEFLTAYVDGVAELSPDERHRVSARLARDPEARAAQAAVRTLLDQLRELPPEGAEPDWMAMERSIRQAVGPEVPRPWWRNWKWLAPATMLATAAAVVLVMWGRPAAVRPLEAPAVAHASHAPPGSRAAEDVVPLWLDGAEVDVDLSASDLLGAADPADPTDPADEARGQPGADPDSEVDLLPSTNLAWVDQLDDDAIARAERWLTKAKG